MALFRSPHLIYKIIETCRTTFGPKVVCATSRHRDLILDYNQANDVHLFGKAECSIVGVSHGSEPTPCATTSHEIAVNAALNLSTSWNIRGRKSFITMPNTKSVPGFWIPATIWNAEYHDPKDGTSHQTILGLMESSGYHGLGRITYGFLVPHRSMTDSDELYRLLKSISVTKINTDYQDLECPNVNAVSKADLNCLKGIGFGQPTMRIVHATEETRFKMEYTGSMPPGTCMGSGRQKLTQPMIINQPFIMFITSSTSRDPLLVSYLPETSWAKEK